MATNDHIVPVMYLKRWAVPRAGGHQIVAAKADQPETSFVTNVRNVAAEQGFYWGETPEGVPHHDMEDLLTAVEAAAKPAFATLLDSGKHASDSAFPYAWPARPSVRLAITWWIAAQVVRTARQRERLWRTGGGTLPLPRGVRVANEHLALHARAPDPDRGDHPRESLGHRLHVVLPTDV